jgi:hypothetical protein
MKICLEEMKKFILNGQHLFTGKPFKNFDDMRSREVLANWLICAAQNSVTGSERFTFSSDPIGGDGIIYDLGEGKPYPTEHVLAPRGPKDNGLSVEDLIIRAIQQKQTKGGAAYASGKTLVVFLEGGDSEWFANRAARLLPQPLLFEAVWVVGLYRSSEADYVYFVTSLDIDDGDAPTQLVHIDLNSISWWVENIQGMPSTVFARFLPYWRVSLSEKLALRASEPAAQASSALEEPQHSSTKS